MTAVTPRGWLIDTNVVSELRKGARAEPAVARWAQSVPRFSCYISRVSLAEIRFGIQFAKSPELRSELESWFRDGVLPWFGQRILDVSENVLVRWCWLGKQGKEMNYTFPQQDGLLAATALEHDLGVVTRNSSDFERAGVMLLNPWLMS